MNAHQYSYFFLFSILTLLCGADTLSAQNPEPIWIKGSHYGNVNSLSFIDNGNTLVSAATRSNDYGLYTWNTSNSNLTCYYPGFPSQTIPTSSGSGSITHTSSFVSTSLGAENKYAAGLYYVTVTEQEMETTHTGSTGGVIVLWNIHTKIPIDTIWNLGSSRSMVLHPIKERIIVSTVDEIVEYELFPLKYIRKYTEGKNQILLDRSNDGKVLCGYGKDSVVRIWSLDSAALLFSWKVNTIQTAVSISSNNTIAFGDDLGKILLVSPLTTDTVEFATTNDIITDVAFSDDNKLLASSHKSGTLKIWDIASKQIVKSFSESQPITAVTFTPDASKLYYATDYGKIFSKELVNLNIIDTVSLPVVSYASFLPNNDIYYGYSDKTYVLNPDNGKIKHVLSSDTTVYGDYILLKDGLHAVRLHRSGQLSIINIWTNTTVRQLDYFKPDYTSVRGNLVSNGDGSLVGVIIVGSGPSNSYLFIYNTQTGARLLKTGGFNIDDRQSFAFHPDNKHVIVFESYGIFAIRDIATGQTIDTLSIAEKRFGYPRIVAVSPDRQIVAVANKDRLYLYNSRLVFQDSIMIPKLDSIHDIGITYITFTPDSKNVAVKIGNKVIVCNIATRQVLFRFANDFLFYSSDRLEVSPDGRYILGVGRKLSLWSGSHVTSNTPKNVFSEHSSIAIYPNPVLNTTALNYKLSSPSPVTITLHDILGREVLRREIGVQAEGEHEESLDVSELPIGSYIVKISTNQEVFTSRISVVR